MPQTPYMLVSYSVGDGSTVPGCEAWGVGDAYEAGTKDNRDHANRKEQHAHRGHHAMYDSGVRTRHIYPLLFKVTDAHTHT